MRFRLGLLMFLQLFIWGSWFVSMGTYLVTSLGANGVQIGLAYSTQSWGAIVAPLLVGFLADRYCRPERVLGVLHMLGAAALIGMSNAKPFSAFYALLLPYMIFYMPTLALANNVCFRRLRNSAMDFSKVRVWGTFGWIVAGIFVSYVFAWDSLTAIQHGALCYSFSLAAVASLACALVALTLPAALPEPRPSLQLRTRMQVIADSAGLLRDKNYLVFFLASILVCIPLAFYYQHTNQFLTELGVSHATGKQTLGQVSELLFMLALPLLLHRLGIKGILLFGIFSWAVRYFLFAHPSLVNSWALLIGIILHGACYDFFFVSGQIYTDIKAGPSIKSSAQGLITLATYGIGMLIGFAAAGVLTDHYALSGGGHDWNHIWMTAAMLAVAIGILFLIFFKNELLDSPPARRVA